MRSVPESGDDEHGERRQQQHEEADGTIADGRRAEQVPDTAKSDEAELPGSAVPAGGPRRKEATEVEDEEGGVDGHVEDAGGEREPGFLVSPEGTHGAAHPDVEAAFFGQGAGEFADHERGGQAPEDRQREQNDEAFEIAGVEDVFDAVGAAGDHEEGGRNERQQPHAAG